MSIDALIPRLSPQQRTVFDFIASRGTAYGYEFLRVGLGEYRKRISELNDILPAVGLAISSRPQRGSKYHAYRVIKVPLGQIPLTGIA